MKTKGLLSVFLVLLAISFLPDLITWIQHRFVVGLNPFVLPVCLFIILLVSIPFIFKWHKWLIRQSFAENSNEPVLLFAVGGLCWMIVYWTLGDANTELQFHETYYILSSFEVWKYISIAFGVYCMIYFVFPVIFGRDLNLKLSRIHFWITYIGLKFLIETWTNVNVRGPGPNVEYAGWDSYSQFQLLNIFIFTVLILIVTAQLLFLFNIISSLLRKKGIQ